MAHNTVLHNPTTESQCARILAWLQLGKPLTATEALHEFGCARLAARVMDLRKEGARIHTKMIRVRNRNGAKCRIAEYWLLTTPAKKPKPRKGKKRREEEQLHMDGVWGAAR